MRSLRHIQHEPRKFSRPVLAVDELTYLANEARTHAATQITMLWYPTINSCDSSRISLFLRNRRSFCPPVADNQAHELGGTSQPL